MLAPGDARVALPLTPVDDAALAVEMRDSASVPFDLAGEVPLRAALFRTAEDRHTLLVTAHHIAADGWSMGPLAQDLAGAYAARTAGRAPSWAPLPVQYTDYTLWQDGLLGSAEDPASLVTGQLAHWKAELAGAPEETPLPCDRPRPAMRRRPGRHRRAASDRGDHGGPGQARTDDGHQYLHGAARRAGRSAPPDRRKLGHRHRHPGGRADGRGAGPAGGLLREHAGPAHGRRPGPHLQGPAGPGAGHRSGRVRPPGTALRTAGGGCAADALMRPVTRCSRSCSA